MADNFRLSVGPSLLLINIIGFMLIPTMINNNILFQKKILSKISPIIFEFVFLIFLGLLFGYIMPWEDLTGDRLWTQQAEGRTIITLIRLLNEFIIFVYIAWTIINNKTTIEKIVYYFAITSIISFWIGFIDYFIDYSIKANLFYISDNIMGRFVGLNGEPKLLGRQGALAYGLITLFYFHVKKDKLLLFAIFTNILAVILSSSASGLVLFVFINLILILSLRSTVNRTMFISIIGIIVFLFFSLKPLLRSDTFDKVETALFGSELQWVENEPYIFTRFDIFDRLALIYLWQNPQYIIFGTGPNLVSIPASKNIPESSFFYEDSRIDSVPNVMFNNILARSGIIGIFLFLIGLLQIYVSIKRSIPTIYKNILIITLAYSMVYFNITFLFLLGVVIGHKIKFE